MHGWSPVYIVGVIIGNFGVVWGFVDGIVNYPSLKSLGLKKFKFNRFRNCFYRISG
jgi:hypothetical protein